MSGRDHQAPTSAPATSERRATNPSLQGSGVDQELERELLARQAALGTGAASAEPEDQTGTLFPSWFTEMMTWGDSRSTNPTTPGSSSTRSNGTASLGPDGAEARSTAISQRDDGRTSVIVGAGHWSQGEGVSADMAASQSQSVLFADSDTSWERTDTGTSASASYGPEAWSGQVARTHGLTSHYQGHEVSTRSRASLIGSDQGVGVAHHSSKNVDDDGVQQSSTGDASLGYSWEHGLNLGYGYSTVMSDGDDFRVGSAYGMSYDRGVTQGTYSRTSHVVGADGRTLDSVGAYSAGWDQAYGFLGSANQSSSVVSGDDHAKRQSIIAYSRQGGLQASMSTSSKNTDGDGIIWSDDRSASASWRSDAQTVALSRTTERNDDGVARSTASQGQFGYSSEEGLNAAASTSRVLADGDDFRLSREADLAFSAQGGHAGMNTTSHVVDADGATHDGSRSGRVGWDPQGVFAEYRQRRSTSEGEDYARRESTLGYRAGVLSAGNTFASRGTAADGTVCTVDAAMSGAWGPESATVSASHATGTSWEGIAGGTSSNATLGRDASGLLTFSGATHTGLADGETYHDRRGATASYQGGIFTAQGTSDVRYTDAGHVRHDQQRAVGFTAGNETAGLTASQTHSSTDDGIDISHRTTGTASVGPDGAWSMGGTWERGVRMDEDYAARRTLGGNITHDGLDISAGSSARWTDASATGHQSTSGVSGGFHNGYANVGGQRSHTVTQADGSSDTRAGQLAVSTDGTASASISRARRDAQGTVTSSHSVTGSADVFGDQRGATATGSLTRGKMTYSAGGGIQYEVNAPVRQGDQWVVSYKQAIHANLGGTGGEAGGLHPTDQAYAVRTGVQGGLSAGAQVRASGVRTFPSEEAATAFYARPDLGVMEGPPTSIADVLAMRDGDSSSSLMSGTLGANGSLGWGPFLTASAGVTGGATTGMTVKRGAGETVFVTVEDANTLAGTVGLSTIGVGMSGGTSTREFEAATWSFDLSKEHAQTQYAAHVGSGQTPVAGDGVALASVTEGSSNTDTAGVTLGGLSIGTRSGTSSQVTTHANGDVVEEDTGTNSWDATARWLGLRASEDHAMTFSETNNVRRDMVGRSVVDRSRATGAYEGLAKAHGMGETWNPMEGASSGKWTYEALFDEHAVDRFVAAVESGEYEPHGGGMISREGWRMQAAVREASGDTDAQRAILAQFIDDGGTEAIAQVQMTAGGRQGFLTLEGSDVWVGSARYQADQSTIRMLREVMASSEPRKSHYDMAAELVANLEYRVSMMGDHGLFPEIPEAIRSAEIARNARLLERAVGLRGDIGAALAIAGVPGSTALVEPESVVDDGVGLDEARAGAFSEKAEMEQLYERALDERNVHESGYPVPRNRLGNSGIGGWAFTAPEYQSYLRIDALWVASEADRRKGLQHERDAQKSDLMADDSARMAVRFWIEATREFAEAVDGFNAVVSGYYEIRRRNASEWYLWD